MLKESVVTFDPVHLNGAQAEEMNSLIKGIEHDLAELPRETFKEKTILVDIAKALSRMSDILCGEGGDVEEVTGRQTIATGVLSKDGTMDFSKLEYVTELGASREKPEPKNGLRYFFHIPSCRIYVVQKGSQNVFGSTGTPPVPMWHMENDDDLLEVHEADLKYLMKRPTDACFLKPENGMLYWARNMTLNTQSAYSFASETWLDGYRWCCTGLPVPAKKPLVVNEMYAGEHLRNCLVQFSIALDNYLEATGRPL